MMQKSAILFRYLKPMLLVWFTLLALSPCVVKESLFNASEVKTLNKARATNQSVACQYVLVRNCTKSAQAQRKIQKVLSTKYLLTKSSDQSLCVNAVGEYNPTFAGNSPPIYILYQRLKLHVS